MKYTKVLLLFQFLSTDKQTISKDQTKMVLVSDKKKGETNKNCIDEENFISDNTLVHEDNFKNIYYIFQ